MPIGSIAGGLIGQQGAQQGGQMAYNAAQQGATTSQNILNDQRNMNRVAVSPYTAGGREAMNQIGQLLGWGNLETNGGDDDWRFANGTGGGPNQAAYTAQQGAAKNSLLNFSNMIASPEFARLNVPQSFEADPGYQFRYDQGMRALDRTAASKGKLLSGGQIKAAQEFNSGLASQEYGNWWNRYTQGTQFNNAASQQEYTNKYGSFQNALNLMTGMSNSGQSAAAGQAGVNSGLATNTGNAFVNAGISGGNALGAGYAKGAENLASGIGSGINNAMTMAYMGFGGANPIFGNRAGKSSYPGSGETY